MSAASLPVDQDALIPLVMLLGGRRVVALTGAGLSTESGIPDYRGPDRAGPPRRPMRYQQLLGDARARQRYWARAALGYRRIAAAAPNRGHAALASLEAAGAIRGVITQNVDRLHQAAGSRRVVELHGALAEVRCLSCDALEPRDGVQARILEENPAFGEHTAALAPDGDVDLPERLVDGFSPPTCVPCGGPLKPDVVFFGENVRRRRYAEAWALFEDAEALLVAGSSLAVPSGMRFVTRAAERRIPVAVVNRGPCAGDPLATVRVEGACGKVLSDLARALRCQVEGLPISSRRVV